MYLKRPRGNIDIGVRNHSVVDQKVDVAWQHKFMSYPCKMLVVITVKLFPKCFVNFLFLSVPYDLEVVAQPQN